MTQSELEKLTRHELGRCLISALEDADYWSRVVAFEPANSGGEKQLDAAHALTRQLIDECKKRRLEAEKND